jgi:ATP-dependent Clp protease adaptor protein ClpS
MEFRAGGRLSRLPVAPRQHGEATYIFTEQEHRAGGPCIPKRPRGDGKLMSHPMHQEEPDLGVSVEDEIREPRQYKVLLHNDDYTAMDFVVLVLVNVFHKTEKEATQIMLNVHNNGVGVCGEFTAEVAELKVSLVHRLARENGYPLKCSMEEV